MTQTADGPSQYPFQVDGTAWLRDHPRALLADDPGLGKTNQLLLAAVEPVLVVAPAMLLGVWADEIELWAPGIDATTVSYSSLCVRGEKNRTSPVPRPEFRHPWGTIIADESHYLKSRGKNGADVSAAFEILSPRAQRLDLSTGTPVPNWGHELYMPIKLLHEPGDRRFSAYWRWIDKWFGTFKTRFSAYNVGPLRKQYTWDDFVRGNDLHELMLRRLRDDVLPELPPLTEQLIEVEMTAAQARAYKQMKRDYIATFEDGHEVLVWTDGAKHTKLLKMATGLEVEHPAVKSSGKLDALTELLATRDSPTLVAVYFRNSATAVERICAKLKKRCGVLLGGGGAGRMDTVRQFQAGKLDVLVGTIDTMAEGLTLTRADQVILAERHPRPDRNEQVIRRLHRIGQTRPVSVIHLRTKNTVDVGQWRLLGRKVEEIEAILTAADLAARLATT